MNISNILKKKSFKVVVIIVAVLIVVRLILPYVVLHYANKTLANMNGYYGQIKDIDLAIIRGAYKMDSIYLNKEDSITKEQTPFFSASMIDLSIEWKALLHGSVVGELVVDDAILKFTKDVVEPDDLQKDSSDFKDVLDGFMPLQVNRFEINNADIHYVDTGSKPKVDLRLTDLHLLALNLKNSYDSSTLLPAKVIASADLYEGVFTFNMDINPLADVPTFDLTAELKNTNLVLLNEFFEAYARLDVNKGSFGLYTEVAAKEGKFVGYVKPLIQDLDILGKEDRDDNLLQKIWEGLAGGTAEIFENQSEDQLGTKIPFSGRIDNPETSIWTTIYNILQNAFISALQPTIDNEITIQTVDSEDPEKKNFIQRIFGSKDDKKKDDKKEKD